jgi:hypothetical protein
VPGYSVNQSDNQSLGMGVRFVHALKYLQQCVTTLVKVSTRDPPFGTSLPERASRCSSVHSKVICVRSVRNGHGWLTPDFADRRTLRPRLFMCYFVWLRTVTKHRPLLLVKDHLRIRSS